MGPSHKRGPPKGYIHAIERRLHQTEALLGAIIGSKDSRALSLLNSLSRDPLANQIIQRVEHGPFGPKGSVDVPFGSTKQDFLASISKFLPQDVSDDQLHTKRQSRLSREELTAKKYDEILVTPSSSWGEGLRDMLMLNDENQMDSLSVSSVTHPDSSGSSNLTIAQSPLLQSAQSSEHMSVNDASETPSAESMIDIDEFSFDANQQLRYHGKASVFYLLHKCNRFTGRPDNTLPETAFVHAWPLSSQNVLGCMDIPNVQMPDSQGHSTLIKLYFGEVHPMFPVIHEAHFLEMYALRYGNGIKISSSNSLFDVSFDLLFLSVCSLSSRFLDVHSSSMAGSPHASDIYYSNATRLLHSVVDQIHPLTCQALLLLGYRGLGTDSGEKAWFYIDTAIRMAQRLGMHRSLESLKRLGITLLTNLEEEMRARTWSGCCLIDKLAVNLTGRAVAIRGLESDVKPPSDDVQPRDGESWSPSLPKDSSRINSTMINLCFSASISLSTIIGNIIETVYPVVHRTSCGLQLQVTRHEDSLEKWYSDLPQLLKLHSDRSGDIAPAVLLLHIQYWWAVILLHRTSISIQNPSITLSKAFSQCQSAAYQITTIVTAWDSEYSLAKASPFLPSYILDVGIIFVTASRIQPWDLQARSGLQQCLTVLQKMEHLWPAARTTIVVLDIISGVTPESPLVARVTPTANEVFGESQVATLNESQMSRLPPDISAHYDARFMGQMLGIDHEQTDCVLPTEECSWWTNAPDVSQSLLFSGMDQNVDSAQWPQSFAGP